MASKLKCFFYVLPSVITDVVLPIERDNEINKKETTDIQIQKWQIH